MNDRDDGRTRRTNLRNRDVPWEPIFATVIWQEQPMSHNRFWRVITQCCRWAAALPCRVVLIAGLLGGALHLWLTPVCAQGADEAPPLAGPSTQPADPAAIAKLARQFESVDRFQFPLQGFVRAAEVQPAAPAGAGAAKDSPAAAEKTTLVAYFYRAPGAVRVDYLPVDFSGNRADVTPASIQSSLVVTAFQCFSMNHAGRDFTNIRNYLDRKTSPEWMSFNLAVESPLNSLHQFVNDRLFDLLQRAGVRVVADGNPQEPSARIELHLKDEYNLDHELEITVSGAPESPVIRHVVNRYVQGTANLTITGEVVPTNLGANRITVSELTVTVTGTDAGKPVPEMKSITRFSDLRAGPIPESVFTIAALQQLSERSVVFDIAADGSQVRNAGDGGARPVPGGAPSAAAPATLPRPVADELVGGRDWVFWIIAINGLAVAAVVAAAWTRARHARAAAKKG